MDAGRSNSENTKISYPSSEVHLWCLLAGKHGGLSLNNVDFGEIHTFTSHLLFLLFKHLCIYPSMRTMEVEMISGLL